MSCQLTLARLAVWDAINHWNWPEGFAWVRKYQSDADTAEMLLRGPAPHELPAIAVAWGEMTVQEFLNTQQRQLSPITISMWFRGDQLSIAELISDQILKCICQSTPEGGTVTYIRQVIGRLPRPLGPLRLSAVTLDSHNVKAWRLDARVGLEIQTDLYHAGA